jgi:hypothetical protein
MRTLRRWVNASHALAKLEPFMVVVAQGLGRLDISLMAEDRDFVANLEKNRESLEENIKLNVRFTTSYLWVLGAYELVRTICQRQEEQKCDVSGRIAKDFRDMKRTFNRLRIPLAKMEPASVHKATDSHIAYPALHREKGISWQVSASMFINRDDLAAELLVKLEGMRADA